MIVNGMTQSRQSDYKLQRRIKISWDCVKPKGLFKTQAKKVHNRIKYNLPNFRIIRNCLSTKAARHGYFHHITPQACHRQVLQH